MAFLLWNVIRKVRAEGRPAAEQNRTEYFSLTAVPEGETSGAAGEKRQRPP